jgi:hypothetical protein
MPNVTDVIHLNWRALVSLYEGLIGHSQTVKGIAGNFSSRRLALFEVDTTHII